MTSPSDSARDPDRNKGRQCLCGADLSAPGSRLHHYCRYTDGGRADTPGKDVSAAGAEEE